MPQAPDLARQLKGFLVLARDPNVAMLDLARHASVRAGAQPLAADDEQASIKAAAQKAAEKLDRCFPRERTLNMFSRLGHSTCSAGSATPLGRVVRLREYDV